VRACVRMCMRVCVCMQKTMHAKNDVCKKLCIHVNTVIMTNLSATKNNNFSESLFFIILKSLNIMFAVHYCLFVLAF